MEIIIPKYFEYHDGLYFTNYFDDISITELSSLYESDRDAFHAVLLEMKMRGFVFNSDNPLSSIFTRYATPLNLIMTENKTGQAFKKIDFEGLGLGSFIYKFGIESDYFFNRFPLEGFLEMNPNANLDLLKLTFITHGFEIIQLSQLNKSTNPLAHVPTIKGDDELTLSQLFDDKNLCTYKPLVLKNEILQNEINSLSIMDKLCYEDKDYLLSMSSLSIKDYKQIRNKLNCEKDDYISSMNVNDKPSLFAYLSLLNKTERNEFLEKSKLKNNLKEISNKIFNMDISSKEYLKLQKYEQNLEEISRIFEDFKSIWQDKINEKDEEMLNKRIVQKLTLQETADSYDITRERVRQVVNNLKNNILQGMREKSLVKRFEKYVLNHSSYYPVKKIRDYLSPLQAEIFLELILLLNSDINYQEHWKIITDNPYLQEDYIFKKYFKSRTIFSDEYIYLVIKDIKNHNPFALTYIQIQDLLLANNYRQHHKIWTSTGMNDVVIYGYIINKYFDGVYHSEQDIDKMKKLYCDIYREKNLKPRNVYARLQENEDYILVNSYLFKNYKMCWSQELLARQIEFVNERAMSVIKKNEKINFVNEYRDYSHQYKALEIESALHAFSILKKFREKKYSFAPGNLLEAYGNDKYHLSRSEELELFVKEHGPILLKSKIESKLEYESYTINQAINESNYLIGWNEGYVRYMDPELLSENEADLEALLKYIINYFGEEIGYPIEPIYIETLFGGFNELYHKLGIENSEQLLSFLASVYKDKFQSKGKFLIKKEHASKFVIEDAVINYLPDYFTKEEFTEIMKNEFNYASVTINQYLNHRYRNNIIYQLDQNLFCTIDEFKLDKEQQNSIIAWVEEQSSTEKYIVINNIFINSNQLPQLNFKKDVSYNEYLIATILEVNGYKLLTNSTNDTFPVLVYSSQNHWDTFEELIHDQIKSKKIYHYDELVDYLKSFFNYNSNINIDSLIRSFTGDNIQVDYETLTIDMERII